MKTTMVTGGSGFLGGWVVSALKDRGIPTVAPPRSECNLLDFTSCLRSVSNHKPGTIIHLAATVGGIGANQAEPGRFFYENAVMGLNLIEAARVLGVKKFVQVGTVCSYPVRAQIPFKETDLWSGYPEPTNAPYGISKKILLTMLQAYRKQYGLNGIYLIPANLYGPGDHSDLISSHVIPALISKFYDAFIHSKPTVKVWGSGSATREFLYVEDAAEAIVEASIKYNKQDPINLGGREEISIRALAEMIAAETGYRGRVVFDRSKPDGQPRRRTDSSRAQRVLGWVAKTPLKKGLRAAIRYVKNNWVHIT